MRNDEKSDKAGQKRTFETVKTAWARKSQKKMAHLGVCVTGVT